MKDDPHRGTGRTADQMRAAPKGAIFIWCNAEISYAERLARHVLRDDLIIVSPGGFDTKRRGRRVLAIIDHATPYSARLSDLVREHNSWVRE